MTATLTRPELTMPPREADALRAAFEAAEVILEYGAGGSTLLAASLPGKRIFSVESDKAWVETMRTCLRDTPPAAGSTVELIWANIGPTKSWGHPADESAWAKYPSYPLGVWSRPGFVAPDVVLVDGRFRIGCALAAAYLTEKPITLLVDDYVPREAYHKIATYLGAPELIGRMARFTLTPQPIPKADWLQITKYLYRPL